jgi:hypothetical protein
MRPYSFTVNCRGYEICIRRDYDEKTKKYDGLAIEMFDTGYCGGNEVRLTIDALRELYEAAMVLEKS